jgi:hypothetical protein
MPSLPPRDGLRLIPTAMLRSAHFAVRKISRPSIHSMTVLEEGGAGAGLVATVSPPLQLRPQRSTMSSSTSSTPILRNSCGAALTARIFPRMRTVIFKSSARTSTICSSTFPRSDPEKVMQNAGTLIQPTRSRYSSNSCSPESWLPPREPLSHHIGGRG